MSDPTPGVSPDWRPRLHFTAPQDWINDPNGLFRLGADWHLHYQFETPRSWGHARSRDLFHWEHLPVALRPDALGDCWSGGTVPDPDNTSGLFAGKPGGLVTIFTSQDPVKGQRISLASSADGGMTWQTAAFNPVLQRATPACRDPKVFWDERRGRWVMVITESLFLTFFVSSNLRDWTETGRFTPARGPGVDGFDCPDLFELPIEGQPGRSKWILSASFASGLNFDGRNGFGACAQGYCVGDYDGQTFHAAPGVSHLRPLGDGPDDYAAIVWPRETSGARRTLLIGWMNHWGYAQKVPTGSWQGNLTVPRELTLHETAPGAWEIRKRVAREFWNLPHRRRSFTAERLTASTPPRELGHLRCGAIQVVLRPAADAVVSFDLFASGTHATSVSYDAAREVLAFDRRNSGSPAFNENFPLRREATVPLDATGALELSILFDRSTVEAWAGAVFFSGLTLPAANSDGVFLRCLAGTCDVERLELFDATEA